MRTITNLCIIFALSMSSIFAQQTRSISELLDVLTENHMEGITDVFTSQEIAILQDHFTASIVTEPGRYLGDMAIHTTENTLANFAKIDKMNLSTVTIIAPSPLNEFEGAGATVPNANSSIVVDNANNFYVVNNVGDYLGLGQIMPDAGQSFTGLEYASDGTLYGIATNGAGSTRLYQINLTAQTATPVGSDNGLVVGIALGRDASNNLYSYDIDTDMVYRINRLTGVPTLLGNIGFDANFGQGLSFNPQDSHLYCSAFNNTTFKPELRTIDTNTGASALVGTIVPSQTYQFAWMSFYDTTLAVTENSTIEFRLSPNPAMDVLTISSDVNIDSIAIYSVLGQLVQQSELNDTNVQIDVSALRSGLYILQLKSGEKVSSKRFVKQ